MEENRTATEAEQEPKAEPAATAAESAGATAGGKNEKKKLKKAEAELNELKKELEERKITLAKRAPGIYDIDKEMFQIQLIVNRQLDEKII